MPRPTSAGPGHRPPRSTPLDGNLWHLSHEGGILEDPWTEPPADAYGLTVSPETRQHP